MQLSEKQFNMAVQKAINDPNTQKKMLELLEKLNQLKSNDVEAFAMVALLYEVMKNLPALKEVSIERRGKK